MIKNCIGVSGNIQGDEKEMRIARHILYSNDILAEILLKSAESKHNDGSIRL
jgi:hypothetical protein